MIFKGILFFILVVGVLLCCEYKYVYVCLKLILLYRVKVFLNCFFDLFGYFIIIFVVNVILGILFLICFIKFK